MKWTQLIQKKVKLKFIVGLLLMVSVFSISNYLTISGKSDPVLLDEPLAVEHEQRQELEENENQSIVSDPEIKPGFYENVVTVANGDATLVLVNKNYALDPSYEPSDLVLPNVLTVGGNRNQTVYLREEAAFYLEQLFMAAHEEAGLEFLARSGYRSYDTQVALYQRYVSENGQEAADRFSARAGHSEHQTGLAIVVTADSVGGDLSILFGETPEGIWLKENAHRFGYIIRYLEGRESETGYQYEPWHIRYVGIEAATEIYENGWILEQYLEGQ